MERALFRYILFRTSGYVSRKEIIRDIFVLSRSDLSRRFKLTAFQQSRQGSCVNKAISMYRFRLAKPLERDEQYIVKIRLIPAIALGYVSRN